MSSHDVRCVALMSDCWLAAAAWHGLWMNKKLGWALLQKLSSAASTGPWGGSDWKWIGSAVFSIDLLQTQPSLLSTAVISDLKKIPGLCRLLDGGALWLQGAVSLRRHKLMGRFSTIKPAVLIKAQHGPVFLGAKQQQSNLATVPDNPPAVFFSSQVSNTTTEVPQPLHPHWVTNTKYHLLWYRSLSQTAFRIAEKLIILLAVFLYKQERAHAKMFWGVISMLLWSGVALPFGVLFIKKHTHTHTLWHPNTRAHASPAVVGNWWWLQIYGWQSGSLPVLLLETCHGFLICSHDLLHQGVPAPRSSQ